MRFLSLAFFLSGALAAQTSNWQHPNLQQYVKQFKLPQTNPPLILQTPGKLSLAPGQKCAIPLINVLTNPPTNDRMVIHPPSSIGMNIVIVTPPAPSCDDVR